MRRAYLLGAALWLAAGVEVVACGGRAALEAYELESASGTGGSSSSSTSSGTGGTGGTTTTTSSSTTSTSTSTSTSTTSSGGYCDYSGDCQVCLDCSINEPCWDAMETCFDNPQCDQFINCAFGCTGPGGNCYEQCAQQFPQGAEPGFNFLYCVFCIECPVDCAATAPPWLCGFDD
ncbi:MAG: hypothetical protein JRI68_27760 [Deltaproteobacteria bacterium]|nr:hypothetical protein [Deltaproteobacteria bacterium]